MVVITYCNQGQLEEYTLIQTLILATSYKNSTGYDKFCALKDKVSRFLYSTFMISE